MLQFVKKRLFFGNRTDLTAPKQAEKKHQHALIAASLL
jgi:hypothetical protein